MRRLAITNQKGGSGKTTTAVNLAAALGELSQRVLLVDLDPQASATEWLVEASDGDGLFDVLVGAGGLKRLIRQTAVPNVQLIPASPALARAAAKADKKKTGYHLGPALDRLPPDWDFVLIDCPPATGFLVTSALASSSEVVAPVEAHVMALAGLASLVKTVEQVQDRLNPNLAITAIVPCRVNRTSHAREVVERLRQRFGTLVVDVPIRESVRLAEAPSFKQAITQYAPSSLGAQDYRAVAAEILARGPANGAADLG
ncbi:MAG TPA: ParA family protein [Chloroflexota bacterium]